MIDIFWLSIENYGSQNYVIDSYNYLLFFGLESEALQTGGTPVGKTYIAVSIGNLKQAKYRSSASYFCPRG